MARTKRTQNTGDASSSAPRNDDAEDMDTDVPQDISQTYDAIFPIYSIPEGKLYLRLESRGITLPHFIDWEDIDVLGVQEELNKHLKVLGLFKYAHAEWPSFDPLCLEFLSTMQFEDNLKGITFRLLGNEYRAGYNTMHKVFGFRKLNGVKSPPDTFDAATAWHELTGCNKWVTGGMPSGLIRDPVLCILHKFLVYNVKGRDEANKVHTVELYLLDCAVKKRKVCPAPFIFTTLQNMTRQSKCRAALPHLATALAYHFKAIKADFPPSTHTLLDGKFLGFTELKHAYIASDQMTFLPYEERPVVKRYRAKEIADTLAQPPIDTPASDAEAGDEDGDDDTVGRGDDSPLRIAASQPSSSIPFDFHAFQSDFNSFRIDLGTQLGQMQQQLTSQNEHLQRQEQRWAVNDQRWAVNDERWAAQAQYWEAQSQYLTEQAQRWAINAQHWEQQQQHMASQTRHLDSLEQQLARWNLPPGGPSNPPPDQQ